MPLLQAWEITSSKYERKKRLMKKKRNKEFLPSIPQKRCKNGYTVYCNWNDGYVNVI